MFNIARPSQSRYDALNGLNSSFVSDPLVASVYDEDPWSSAGTPAIVEPVSNEFSGVIGMYNYELANNDSLKAGSDDVPPFKEMHRYHQFTLRLSTPLTLLVLAQSP
jgi:hypothetical protein